MVKSISHREILVFGMLIGIQIVVIIIGACFVSVLYREIMNGGSTNIVDQSQLKNVKRRVELLEKNVNGIKYPVPSVPTGSQPSEEVVKLDYRGQQLLSEMLSDYYIEKNSLVVNGALRLRVMDQLFFSVEIPKEIYADFPLVSYRAGEKFFHGKINDQITDVIYLTQDSTASPSERIDLGFTWSYFGGKEKAECEGENDLQTLAAANIFESLFDLSQGDSHIDLCKYLIAQKNVPGVDHSVFMNNPPSLSKYTLKTDTDIVAFTLDMERLAQDGIKVFNPMTRYYIVFNRPKEDDSTNGGNLYYRMVSATWWSGTRDDSQETLKANALRAKQVLNVLEKSLVEKTIAAPLCEYGCAY